MHFAGLCAAGLALPEAAPGGAEDPAGLSAIHIGQLPVSLRAILSMVPPAHIGADGYLYLWKDGSPPARAPLAPTQWNRERSRRVDRLSTSLPWTIVLHWYGDRDNFDRTVKGYLRGFDSLRPVDDYITRTSAHYLVGWAEPRPADQASAGEIGILQTQAPDSDGCPFLASHLMPLDHEGHKQKKQYFVRALYQLEKQGSGVHTILQDMFDGHPQTDPNLRTIAIEICGYDFDSPESALTSRQIANVVGVVWAVMKRYAITLPNILGHHEIQLGKADPGKKFTALIRYLIAVKALVENDATMLGLVFGPFWGASGGFSQTVRRCFGYIRDYLVLVGTQRDVYEWEAASKFWLLDRQLFPRLTLPRLLRQPLLPLPAVACRIGSAFLTPHNHEGIDLYPAQANAPAARVQAHPVILPADGECLYAGPAGAAAHPGGSLIFRHLQPDGARVLSVFTGLSAIDDIQPGKLYPLGSRLGWIQTPHLPVEPFLHLALAYGATWDTDLSRDPQMPLNAGEKWILARYLDPLAYVQPG